MCIFLSKVKLWRLEVASTEDPRNWAKERSDEGELVEVRPRQLGGVVLRGAMGRQNGGLLRVPLNCVERKTAVLRYGGFFGGAERREYNSPRLTVDRSDMLLTQYS